MGIKDVAARAGVSISTVSYVMSGKRTISKETRDKVMQAAADLGIGPSCRRLGALTTGVSMIQWWEISQLVLQLM